MSNPKKYPVELTLTEIIAVRDLIRSAHDSESYYAGKRLDEGEDWQRSCIVDARNKQVVLSALHVTLTGEPLTAAVEAEPTVVGVEA